MENVASSHVKTSTGGTPLHTALQSEKIDTEHIIKLLDEGADIDAKDTFGKTPFHYALQNHSVDDELITTLLERGASCSESDHHGNMALHVALKKTRSLKVIQEILKHGGEVNATNAADETPMFIACDSYLHDRLEVFEELLNHGALVTVKDRNDQTPLQMALRHGRDVQIIIKLLRNGAEVNSKDKSQESPLAEIAQIEDRNETYFLLLTHWGASVHKCLSIDNLHLRYNEDEEAYVQKCIKYALVEHPDDIVCDYCENLLAGWPPLVICFRRELEKMKREYIVEKYSLYDFISKKRDYGEVFIKEIDVIRQFSFPLEMKIRYPIYYNILLLQLKSRTYSLRYFYDTVFIIEINNKLFNLSHCVLRIMAKYLSIVDMFNVMCAFSIHNTLPPFFPGFDCTVP